MQHSLIRKAYFWETAPFFRLLLPLIASIIFYSFTSYRTALCFLVVSITCTIVFIVTNFINKPLTFFHAVRFILISTSLFSIGWLLCYYNDVKNDQNWFGNNMQADAYIARISSEPMTKEKTWKLEVNVLYNMQNGQRHRVNGEAFVYVFRNNFPITIQNGDTIILPNNWQGIKNAGNPFEFDYVDYCAKNNLYYTQFISGSDIKLYNHGIYKDKSITERAHDWCMDQLATYLPDSATAGLIQAMLLGDEIHLDEHLLQAYADTGIVHIIAISGGNVAIFFLIISFLLWWIKDAKYRWIKYIVALPLVWFYVLMAGAPPSAIRAAIMFSILAIGFSLNKQHNSLNFLLAAAFILLCAVPMWLFSVGFQLSFIAVLSLILFYAPIYQLFTPTHIIIKNLWSTIVASLAAEILVAPVVIYYFHLFPLWFLAANVIAYLFMGLTLILGMAIVGVSYIPIVAKAIGTTTIFIVTIFDRIVYWLQQQNPVALHYLYLKNYELALIYTVITGIAIYLFHKNKPSLYISMLLICLLFISIYMNESVASHQQKLVVYNAARSNQIELIQGKYHYTVVKDPIDSKKMKYIADPSHTVWRAWRTGILPTTHYFIINGKSVLVLDTGIQNISHADHIIITKTLQQDPRYIIKVYYPKEVVLASASREQETAKWERACKENNIRLFVVRTEGAYVLE